MRQNDMQEDISKQLESMVKKMPAFPQSVQRVLEMTSDLNCSEKELVKIIEHDPVMTVNILKLLNSAYYNLSRQITSVKRAVVYVGFNTIKNMSVSIATVGMLSKKNLTGFNMDQFLRHSLATAAIAKTLGTRLAAQEIDKTDCFVGGLIHDFGKIVFAQFKPIEFGDALTKCRNEAIPLHQAELETIGADHSLSGSLLGKKWRFPDTLVACIGEHHNNSASSDPMQDCVIAANQISKKLEFGFSGNRSIDELPRPVADQFGMNLSDLIKSLGDLSSEMEEVNAFSLI